MTIRDSYQSDGRAAWERLPTMMAGGLAAALCVGFLLKVIFTSGWYYRLLIPFALGMALAGVVFLLIGWAKLRNRWLAGVLGATLGGIAYLSYFQFCLMDFLPPPLWHRIDLLPRFVVSRMKTDIDEDDRRPVRNQPQRANEFGNWFAFLMELGFIAGSVATMSCRRAGRAFSPEHNRWLDCEHALLPRHSGPAFSEALNSGSVAEFVAATAAGQDKQTACDVSIEYLKGQGSPLSNDLFLTVEDFPEKSRWFRPQQLRSTVLKQVRLEPSEVLSLRAWFPKLAEALNLEHEELRNVPANVLAAPTHLNPTTSVMQVTPVPEAYRQKVRTKGYAWKINLIGASSALYFFGGLGLLVLGIQWLDKGHVVPGVIAVVAAAVGTVVGGYIALYCLGVPENRWIERRLRSEVAQRPDSTLDPAPNESTYLTIIPRESFVVVKMTMSSDLLLMKLDSRQGELILEGDIDRYRIPVGAISVCEPQLFFHPIDAQHKNELWMVRLLVRVDQGMRELLLSVGMTKYWPPTTNRRRRSTAEETCGRIRQFCSDNGHPLL